MAGSTQRPCWLESAGMRRVYGTGMNKEDNALFAVVGTGSIAPTPRQLTQREWPLTFPLS